MIPRSALSIYNQKQNASSYLSFGCVILDEIIGGIPLVGVTEVIFIQYEYY